MNKTLMITTGGTLACTPSENGLMPTLKGKDIISFATVDVSNIEVLDFKLIDSSIMTDQDRLDLANLIWSNYDKYDSFIITHGTDSMAYTAAYLDCCLNNFDKTVVITGSQLPLPQQGTDAVDNLNLAIETANKGYFGICIAMAKHIVPAKTATKTQTEGFFAFESVTGDYLESPMPLPSSQKSFNEQLEISSAIIYITPNLKKEVILKYNNVDALLVLVLGAGGMLTHQEQALEILKQNGTKIYIKSQCLYGNVESIYQAHTGMSKFSPITNCSNDWASYAISFGLI